MKLSFINAIGNVLISVILIMSVFKDAKYYGRIIGNAFPIILISFFIVYYFFNQERKIKKKFWKFGLKYSLPIIPHAISQIIMTSLDRIMIFYMIGQVQSGIYSFSYNIFTLVQVTTGSIDSAWGPWFYEKMNSKDYKRIRYCSDMVIIGTSFFLSAIMCFSPELILIMGSGKYADSIYTVLPIVVSGFFSFIYSFPAYIEYYYSKTKYIAYGTMLAALINIILNFLFINHYGYVAAAYTTLFTYMFYFGIHYFLSKRLFNYKLFSLRLVLLLSLVLIVINFIVLFTINSLTIRVILFVVLGLLYYFIMSRKYDVNDMVKAVVLKIRSIN
jgi:O-antigen/teichoic acid export membrane protein